MAALVRVDLTRCTSMARMTDLLVITDKPELQGVVKFAYKH